MNDFTTKEFAATAFEGELKVVADVQGRITEIKVPPSLISYFGLASVVEEIRQTANVSLEQVRRQHQASGGLSRQEAEKVLAENQDIADQARRRARGLAEWVSDSVSRLKER